MTSRPERTWRCDCGDDHFLTVGRWPVDPEGYLSLTDGTHCVSLRCRLKAAWNLVIHGRGFSHWGIEVILDPVTVRELVGELQEQWGEAAE